MSSGFYAEDDFGISEIIPNRLYISDINNAVDNNKLDDLGINAIINVCNNKSNTSSNYLNIWLPLKDGAGNAQDEFNATVDTLGDLIKEGKIILVHCLAGMSRSTSIVITWYAKEHGITFDEATVVIKNMRPITSPHYELRKLARNYLNETDFWFGGNPEL